ncbi:hypothetical protein VHEMI09846 [[Torrubiella] hemipterigena]|uniref:Fungal-type protein kinase domain-containing protein n=1 Tax=[Torrubiella] hemipterigena TaxID=1531966 RepID=A0A0A1TB88_9HYPO|nr:hypothetical protein VHEMI09846 [[Torrubiella] hemipterigena]
MQVMTDCPGSALVLEPRDEQGWDNTHMIAFAVEESLFSYPLSLAQLYVLARHVFFAQPLRYSLHGILVYGDVVELWVFDRSGMYCSEPFSLRDDYALLVSIVRVYANKTDEELGVGAVLAKDDVGNYIAAAAAAHNRRLYLEDEAFVDRGKFFGDGLLCYRAKHANQDDWTHVVKLKWRDANNKPEEDVFNYIQSKMCPGRSSLQPPSQRCKDLSSDPLHEDPGIKGLLRFAKEGEHFFTPRILTHLVFTPLGRPLHTWRSILELLTVLWDGIEAHRSLLWDPHVLHRDISGGNIIIIIRSAGGTSQGVLIDLDRAMNLDIEHPKGGHFTGTRLFTAIGLLTSDAHTYRHDLESFFYLFIWLVICQGEEHLPEASETKAWAHDDRFESANARRRDMKKDRFQLVLEQFDAKYEDLKDLTWRLRAALFRPDENDELQIGTDVTEEGINTLYDTMIGAFEQEMAKWQN